MFLIDSSAFIYEENGMGYSVCYQHKTQIQSPKL